MSVKFDGKKFVFHGINAEREAEAFYRMMHIAILCLPKMSDEMAAVVALGTMDFINEERENAGILLNMKLLEIKKMAQDIINKYQQKG